MRCFTGKVISEGIAVGHTHILKSNSITSQPFHLELEKKKLKLALEASVAEVKELEENFIENKEYFSMQILLLTDPILYQNALVEIERGYIAIEAITNVIQEYMKSLSSATNSYLTERTMDLADIQRRIVRILLEQKEDKFSSPFVLVCEELYPSFLIQNSNYILGIITNRGGYNSHGAILCRQFNIPYMISEINVEEGMEIIIDTRKKSILLSPTKEEILYYQKILNNLSVESFHAVPHKNFMFLANVSSNIELDKIIDYGFDGIGLYRTEMIFMNNNRSYTLEEQFEIYSEAIEKMKHKSVCFRTFDIGDDKQLSYVKSHKKGIDNYINNPLLFKTQIKALLKANLYNTLKIMFPMITNLEEFHFLKRWVYQIQKEINDASKFKLGIMLETREALENITSFIDVDFISIGTNDLIYSIYHVNRNEQKEELEAYLNDLLLQLKKVIIFCENHGIELSICGELAAIEPALREFIKLGVKNFSVAAPAIRVLNRIYKEFN